MRAFRVPTATHAETDETLAGLAAGGCRASFAVLIERHYDRIHRLAWRWSGSREAAEDIAQDVCVKVAGAITGFRGDAAFKTWLHRIAYTTALDHMRNRQRMTAVEPSEIIRLIDREERQAAEDGMDDSEIWQAVHGLPPQQRDAVLLIYGEDLSHAEAARVMDCSEKTVSWHVHEAKKKLKIALKAVG
jgi:RNA polymerase sigma-70 factor (ECF subfamily)